MEIAKFRAGRMPGAQIVEEYKPADIAAPRMMVCAFTSRFNRTIYDAHVNLLRSRTETFSACVAGVDSIVTTPFDVPYKAPDAFSERIARNQQFLLKEESHMDKVVDPAGGSYYVETLTVAIAKEAWKLFLATVDGEGFFASVGDGTVQKVPSTSRAPSVTPTSHAARKSSWAPTSTPTSTSLPPARLRPTAHATAVAVPRKVPTLCA